MKAKLLAILVILAVALYYVPAQADAPIGTNLAKNPTAAQLKGHKIGDKIVFGTGLVGELQGIDANTGRGVFTSNLGVPQYKGDLKTTIKTNWIKFGNTYRTQDNSFEAVVKDNKTTVTYQGKVMAWQPELIVNNQLYSPTAPFLITDPLNNNYGTNTVQWNYPAGITRYLRQIEGVLMDYYTLASSPSGDIVVRDHVTKQGDFNYERLAYATDSKGKSIPITDANGMKVLALKDLQDVSYPVTFDPSSGFYTSASDAALIGSLLDYTVTHDQTTADYVYASSTTLSLGQTFLNSYYGIARDVLYFDTSSLSIPPAATITGASLGIYCASDDSVTDFAITVETGNTSTYPHDPAVAGDYYFMNYTFLTSGGSWNTSAPLPTNAYTTITLNSTGVSWINPAGITKFYLVSSRDLSSTAPTGGEDISIYSYEKGAGYRPVLIVTYLATIPNMQTNAATSISGTSAMLNGEILSSPGAGMMDSRGFVWSTTSHGDPGNVAPASSGYSDNWTEAGSYSFGSFNHTITSLANTTTYYFRAMAHNTAGYAYGGELYFTTVGIPTITTNAATTITASTARLQSSLTSSGGENCTVRFGWGTANAGDNITAYQHYSSFSGAWQTGDNPYLDITGLVGATLYYFNVEASNVDAGNGHGTSTSFTTSNGVGVPTNVSAISTGSTVVLSWSKGVGATDTKIRYAVNACPTDNVTGTEIYSSTASTFTQTGLTPGNDYCYWLAGYDSTVGYSSTAVTIHATTSSDNATGGGYIPTNLALPSNFLSDPDASGLQNTFILDPIMRQNAAEVDMPINWAYALACMVLSGMIGAVAWFRSKKPIIALAVFTVGLFIGNQMNIMPGYVIWLLVVIDTFFIILELRKVP